MNKRNYFMGALGALIVLAVAACGGGSGSSQGPIPQYPAPSPAIGGGALAGASSSAPFQIGASTGLGVGTISIKGTGAVSVSQSTTLPSSGGLVALSMHTLKNGAQPKPMSTTDPNTIIAYVTVTATSTSTLDGIVGINIAPTGTMPAGTYLESFWNGTQWVTFGSAGKVTNGVLSFGSATLSPAANLTSGQSYYVAIYAGVQLTTPSPNPPSPVASPATMTVTTGLQSTFSVTTNPNSTVTAVSNNLGVVTVVTSPVTSNSSGVATVTLKGVAPGQTTVTVTDQIGQTTTVNITDSNIPPTPIPSPASGTLGLGDQVPLVVPALPGKTINVASSNTAVLTVSPATSATGAPDGSGITFTVTAAGPGTATVTFTDPTNQNQGTFSGTVSNIKNGAFTSGLTNWTPCSYPHSPLAGAVNESTPIPSPAPSQSPGAATAAVVSSLTALAQVTAPPANDNPSPPPGIGATAPPVLGSSVALIGSLNDATVNFPKGEVGICQSVSVSANTPYLSFYTWEGGEGYAFKTADTNATVLTGSAGSYTIAQTLMAQQHCYIHPPTESSTITAPSTNGCFPAAYGGDTSGYKDWIAGGYWQQRGPFNLSAYAGQTVTLYFGLWSFYANTSNTYSNFVYLGDVQMLPTTTLPTVAPLARHASTVQMIHHP